MKCVGSGTIPTDTYVNRYGHQRCNECHWMIPVRKDGKTRVHQVRRSPSGTGIEALLSF